MSPQTGNETSDSFRDLARQLEAAAMQLVELADWMDADKKRPQDADVLHSTGVWKFVRGKLPAYIADANRKLGRSR
jgi:hypothetical protein